MAKTKTFTDGNGLLYVAYACPGCKYNHHVPAERWHWNGSIDFPTLSPSVKHFVPACGNSLEETICHYFIVDGKINFCDDCKHSLRGSHELPEIDSFYENKKS